MKQQTRGSLMLLLCAMVWGAAFVAQSEGMNYVGPFTMQAARYFLAGLVLVPVIFLRDKKGISVRPAGKQARHQFVCGVICGVILCAASIIQQYGIIHTTVGKSGFVTALYIVFVPILGALMGRRAGLKVWLCALAAVFGMYLLCVGSGFSVSGGDLGFEAEERPEETEEQKDLFAFMAETLGDKVKAVRASRRLKTHPVCLTSEGEVSLEMEKVLDSMPGNAGVKAERVLEINESHPLFQKLTRLYADDQEALKEYSELLYDQAALMEGLPIDDPVAFAEKVCRLMAQDNA